MTFGEKLRKARIEKGMTQAELGKAANIGVTSIGNYEKGKTYPQNRKVYDILANILDVDVIYLRNENEEFITEATEKYGYRGKKQADQLVQQLSGLFAGGELSDSEIDGVMKALYDVYWECKEENRKKYTPKKYKKAQGYDD